MKGSKDMAKRRQYIQGFYERVDDICIKSGKQKNIIAELMGYDRKACYPSMNGWGAHKIARFCEVTGADANYLLGLKEGKS